MKRIILTLIALLPLCFVNAQDIATLFAAMPQELMPQLSASNRKDLVESKADNKVDSVQNTMNGLALLEQMNDNFMQLQISKSSTIQLRLLPLINQTNILCMVTTVKGPVADSRIAFFTTDWQPIDGTALFTPLKGEAFILPSDGQNDIKRGEALAKLDMDLIEYALSPDNDTLTATYHTPEYLSKEEREAVKPYVKAEPIIMKWNKNRFI